jgi:hypothetical protein
VGCWPPPWQVAIHNPGEPSFVHSLDRTIGGRYVLGSSQGWNALSARLMMLDSDTLARVGSIAVDAETVHARFDQWSGEVVALAEADNEVRYQRYQIIASQHLDLIDERFLCDHCVVAWGGPETVEAYSGAAVRDLTDNRLRVFVMPRDGLGEMYTSEAIEGSSPQLISSNEDLVLLYLHDQHLWERTIDRFAGLAQPHQRSVSPLQSLLGASSYSDNIVVAAVLTADVSNPQIELIKWTSIYSEERITVPAPMGFAVEGAVSFSPNTVAVVWGRIFDDVGAHFLGARTQLFQPIFGPERISAPVNQSSSSYIIWAATAHHPTGHAVVWGGWHEDGNYGIYGKIIPCLGGL